MRRRELRIRAGRERRQHLRVHQRKLPRVGGDFSISAVGEGVYFHLIWTRKDHGAFRSVVWHYSKREEGDLIPATIKLANGRTSGTFSGVSTKAIRTTGSFSCG